MQKNSALDGVRILDLTNGISGPFCTMLLGDLGAEVIKVEKPPRGDDFRQASPVVEGESYYFMLANRNKKSIGLNLKSDEGRKILHKLIENCDIFVENYRPNTTTALGIDYESVRKINPKLIHCSITGFGQTGPYKERAAFDLIIQGMSGLMDVTGERSPTLVGTAIVDMVSGLYGAYAILAALQARISSGLGQHIDVAMLDSMISMMISAFAQYFGHGVPPRMGYRSGIIVPFGIFRASDDSFVLEAASDGTWQRLCVAIGRDDMAHEARFKSIQDRVWNRDELISILENIFLERTADEWVKLLSGASVPCGKILNLDEVLNDEQVIFRKLVQEVSHPILRSLKLIGPAVGFSETPARISSPPPLLGEHNEEILSSVGLSQTEIEDLALKHVVFSREDDQARPSKKA